MPFRLPPQPLPVSSSEMRLVPRYPPQPMPVPGGDALLPPTPIVLPHERALVLLFYKIANALSPDPRFGQSGPKGTVGAMRAQELPFRRSENVEDARDIQPVPFPLPITPPQGSLMAHWTAVDRLVVPPSPPLERVPPSNQLARDAGIENLMNKVIFAPRPPPSAPKNGIQNLIDDFAASPLPR
jgi:hypothetical protein